MATDEELLADFARGDELAFEELLRRYERELFAFLRRFLSDPTLAEDVFQEAFLQVYRSVRSFDSTRRFRPWLFTIAANKARDYLRVDGRRTIYSLDAIAGLDEPEANIAELAAHEVPVAQRMMDQEQGAAVQAVLARLPAKDRELLLLSYFHRFAYGQIAEMLHLPLGTVKSRLHVALARFRRLWNGRPADKG